jgi:tetratricopeptide (TPR) repeat protein
MLNKKIIGFLLCLGAMGAPVMTFAQGTPTLVQRILEMVEEAKKIEATGNYVQAEALWNKIIQLNPKEADAYTGLGNVLFMQRKYKEATIAYQRSIQLEQSADAYIGLGKVLRRQKKLDDAISSYNKAIQIDPQNADAYIQLGVALYGKKQFKQAREAFQKAIQLDGNNGEAYIVLGNTLRTEGRLDEAIAAYQRALALPAATLIGSKTNTHALAYNGWGLILVMQKEPKLAIDKFKEALKLDPKFIMAQNNLKEAERRLTINENKISMPKDDRKWVPKTSTSPLLRSVVKIVADNPDNVEGDEGDQTGSGWVIKRTGNKALIVTNRHVVTDANGIYSTKIRVDFYSEPPIDQVYYWCNAKILKTTDDKSQLDLAILEVTNIPNDVKPLTVFPGKLNRTTPVRIVGHPANSIYKTYWSIVDGKISNIIPQFDKIQINATFAPGNSGGPVVDEQDRVVGLVVETISSNKDKVNGGFGYADTIESVNRQLRIWKLL